MPGKAGKHAILSFVFVIFLLSVSLVFLFNQRMMTELKGDAGKPPLPASPNTPSGTLATAYDHGQIAEAPQAVEPVYARKPADVLEEKGKGERVPSTEIIYEAPLKDVFLVQ